MKIEFDPNKSAKNAKERGLPFEQVAELEWDRADIVSDRRRDYGEERSIAFLPHHGRLYAVCFSIGAMSSGLSVFVERVSERRKPMQRPPLTDEDGEVRELTVEDFKAMCPIEEVQPGLADAIKAMRNKGGRPRVENARAHIAFRWAPDLVASIKATGKGYNARIEKLLRDALAKGDL